MWCSEMGVSVSVCQGRKILVKALSVLLWDPRAHHPSHCVAWMLLSCSFHWAPLVCWYPLACHAFVFELYAQVPGWDLFYRQAISQVLLISAPCPSTHFGLWEELEWMMLEVQIALSTVTSVQGTWISWGPTQRLPPPQCRYFQVSVGWTLMVIMFSWVLLLSPHWLDQDRNNHREGYAWPYLLSSAPTEVCRCNSVWWCFSNSDMSRKSSFAIIATLCELTSGF